MKPFTRYLKQIAGVLFVTIIATSGFAYGRLNCPRLTNDQYPALLFIEGPVDGSHLYLAYFDGQTLHREKIISSKYIQVTQLDDAVFLISAQQSNKNGRVYAIDLSAGVVKFLAESTRIHCLRSEPRRKKAMLVDVNMNIGEVRLIELNLESLEATLRHTLSKKLLCDKFDGIGPRMKLSPDFKHIAYVSKKTPLRVERWSECTLRVLDLSTMKIEELDSNVGVQISMVSSFTQGTPPFEWLNNDEVLYQDMVANEPDEISRPAHQALHIFKRVNIKTKKISECLRKELPLTLDGGSLKINPLNGKLIYNNEWVLNLEQKALTAKNFPFSIVTDNSTKQTQILHGTDVLYSGSERCIDTSISASGDDFAYSLRPRRNTLVVKLYAKIEGRNEPVKMAEGPYLPTRPVGWIQETVEIRCWH